MSGGCCWPGSPSAATAPSSPGHPSRARAGRGLTASWPGTPPGWRGLARRGVGPVTGCSSILENSPEFLDGVVRLRRARGGRGHDQHPLAARSWPTTPRTAPLSPRSPNPRSPTWSPRARRPVRFQVCTDHTVAGGACRRRVVRRACWVTPTTCRAPGRSRPLAPMSVQYTSGTTSRPRRAVDAGPTRCGGAYERRARDPAPGRLPLSTCAVPHNALA